jgi:hypothetical protein
MVDALVPQYSNSCVAHSVVRQELGVILVRGLGKEVVLWEDAVEYLVFFKLVQPVLLDEEKVARREEGRGVYRVTLYIVGVVGTKRYSQELCH